MTQRDVESRIQDLVDGKLAPDERAALLAEIGRDPALLDIYWGYAVLESAFVRLTRSGASLRTEQTVITKTTRRSHKKSHIWWKIVAGALAVLSIEPSMSRRGNCYDNAAMKSLWATLKAICFDREIPATRRQAHSMIFDYIETFYNPRRRYSSLDYLQPAQFEQQTQSKPLFQLSAFSGRHQLENMFLATLE